MTSIIILIHFEIRLYSITAKKIIVPVSFFHLGGFTCYNHIGTSVINWHLLHCIIVSCHHRWCSYLPCPGPTLCPWTSSSARWDISQQLLRAISTVWRAKTGHTISLFSKIAYVLEIFETHTLRSYKWNLLVIEAIHIVGVFTLQKYLYV